VDEGTKLAIGGGISLVVSFGTAWVTSSWKTKWAIHEELAKSPIRIREEKLKSVYARLAKVIEKMFILSNQTYDKASILLTSYNMVIKHEDKIKQYDDFVAKFGELHRYIFGRIIFLPDHVHKALDAFTGSCRDMTLKFQPQEVVPGQMTKEKIGEFMDYWKKQREQFDKSVSQNYLVLCKEIQIAIGLEEPTKRK
jgi:hypothetical protein